MLPLDVPRGSLAAWAPGVSRYYVEWGGYRVCECLMPDGTFFMPFLGGKLIGPRFETRRGACGFCESHAARRENDQAQG